jgi:HEAT repeat protein
VFAQPLQPSLDTLVRNLDRDAVRSKRLIRRLFEQDRDSFLRHALQVLKSDLESPGALHLTAVLAENGLLLGALSDPLLPREKAVALAQSAARIDPNIDLTLARTLADDLGASDSDRHGRLMEILGVISDGIRIFPSLVRLLRHPNPHIRSKAVLLIGRGNRSPKWLRLRLADTDPRIRANAAEALWGVNTEEARNLLQSLVRDSNNRVAGNAILGLYKLGDASMIVEIMALARHDSALFRATAAWVMGETGDPRFTETVACLLREPNAVVRKRAFAALGGIRAAMSQATRGPKWMLSARLLESEPGKPRRILLGVPGGPALLGTQIFVAEDGEPVLRYRVVERPLPETISVVFLVPRSGGNPASSCLPWKRPRDLWACLYYGREALPHLQRPEIAPRFQSAPSFNRIPPAVECLDLWDSLAVAVSPDGGGGKRHVIVVADGADRRSPPEELRAAVAAGQALVQVVSEAPDPVLEDFCRSVGGIFRLDSPEEAYLTLSQRYEVIYQALKPEPASLRIRTHGPGMLVETTLTTSNPSPVAP